MGIKDLGEAFCVTLRIEPAQELYDSFYCWEVLKDIVKTVEWFHFYDFVQLVGKKLRKVQDSNDLAWQKEFGVEKYKQSVNEIFLENKIAWRLNADSDLIREMPTVLAEALQRAESSLKDEFEPSREHYRKSVRFIYERPIDPQNSIKEYLIK